jgi:heptaprenylglyceryl phosphate synthase
MSAERIKRFFLGSRTKRRLHLVSIDPCSHDPGLMAEKIVAASEAGADGFLLGGSTGVDRGMIEDFTRIIVDALQKNCEQAHRPPLILLPSSAQTGIASKADGCFSYRC